MRITTDEYMNGNDPRIPSIMAEITEVLTTRSDAVTIKITRTDEYPPHKGKQLIVGVELITYACG